MARKRYKPEEIVNMLRQADVLHGQGMSMADGIRQLGQHCDRCSVGTQRGFLRPPLSDPDGLRHSYALRAAALGESVAMIGKLPGHT